MPAAFPRRPTAFVFAAALLALAGCGEPSERPKPAPPVGRVATGPPSIPTPDEAAVRAAVESVLAAVDADDAKRFASLAVEPKDKAFRPLDAKEVESTVADLHQKYGALPRTVVLDPSSAYALGVASATVVFGERADAISFTLTRLDGVWKLSSIGSADAVAVDLSPAAPAASDPPPK